MNTLNLGKNGLVIKAPYEEQQFTSHQQWVNKASSWLTCHPDYRNTEHGEAKGWRGHHFTALCFDSKGRRRRNGADFKRAEVEGAFPIWWIWPDQIPELIARLQDETPSEFERLIGKENSHV